MSLLFLSACGGVEIGDSQQIDDEIVLAAPADTDNLPNDLPDTVEVITGSGGRHIYFLTDAPTRRHAFCEVSQCRRSINS